MRLVGVVLRLVGVVLRLVGILLRLVRVGVGVELQAGVKTQKIH